MEVEDPRTGTRWFLPLDLEKIDHAFQGARLLPSPPRAGVGFPCSPGTGEPQLWPFANTLHREVCPKQQCRLPMGFMPRKCSLNEILGISEFRRQGPSIQHRSMCFFQTWPFPGVQQRVGSSLSAGTHTDEPECAVLDVMVPACAPVCGQTSTQTPCSVLKTTRMGTHPLRARTTVRQTPYFSTGRGKQVVASQHSGGTCPPSSFLSHELSEPDGGHRESGACGRAPAACTFASRGHVGRGRVRRLPGAQNCLVCTDGGCRIKLPGRLGCAHWA